ncbi:alpha/beta hydrolase [Nocardioides sp. AE5]|uniref:alpha/beta hydrolase n=1 Tax=Nocardioides sp. AE5 TaxID=2962573 RepID=UPI0028812111|nr:alpha/beta hydrolase [Nocardioides sp. AE5]MDT0200569.1 alpha/beta hydrolase [Nocardioides sp. AE5]
MKRIVALVLVVALVLLGLAGAVVAVLDDGGSGSPESSGVVGPPAGAGEDDPGNGNQQAPDPALQPFYDQEIEWSTCQGMYGESRECGWLEVPLDYDDPEGTTIEIKLLKRPADDQENVVGPLIVNPGGPGAPGTSYADQAEFAFGEPLRERFDIIGFDPRGTGESAPVDCLTDDELDAYLAADPSPDDEEELAEFQEWETRMGEGCATRSGDISAHISTVEAARDMDVLRGALRQPQMIYFGASYGTVLGATYADLFPESSGRLVLDGAVDVSLSSREQDLQQAMGFERALTAYLDDCVAGGDCYLGEDTAAAKKTITDFIEQVDEEPMQVGERVLDVGNAFYGIVLPLYNHDYWTLLDSALSDALEGDAAELLQLSDYYGSREDSGYTDNSSEAIWAINCLDDNTFTPIEDIPDEIEEFRKVSPTFGDIFAWGLYGCAGLQVPPAEQRPPLTAKGADPLLVVGTTRDPATPYEWAEALADQLEPAILLKRDGDGHTAYNMGSDCIDDTIEAYLIDGEVPSGMVDCS